MKKINRHVLKQRAKALARKAISRGRVKGKVLAKKAVKKFFVEEKRLRTIIRKELNSLLKDRYRKKKKR